MMRATISWMLSCALVATAMPVTAAADASATVSADEYTIRCESGRFGRQKYCPAETDGRVRLVRDYSRGRCVEWRTWGYDRRGVWVDNGCKAEFRVGKDGGIGTGGAVAIGGAVAGAAILAAILANRNKDDHKDEAQGAEDWMVGRFRGFAPLHDRDFEITVERNGTVTGESQGDTLTGHISKDRLHLGDSEFKLKKESWGFQATRADDSKDQIFFRKQ
jgi:hypothetical protein